ncbi:MAG TPA: MFS transporter [Bdellovibrionota bacterium]|jgi:EmrB/QacA subfamily drug resistance transporter
MKMGQTDRTWVVIALLCAVFLAAMEATAVATVMPTIIGDLGGLNHYAWVFTAYMMSSTVTVPIYGKLSDLYGRKPVLQIGIALFLLGSLLSAMSRTMIQLILFRAIQGLGAGAIQPTGLTITGDLFKLEERARVTAIFGTVWGVAGVLGPLIGGLIVKTLGWPWIFYVNIPFAIASTLIIQWALVEDVERKKTRLDWLGAIFLSLTIVGVLLAVNDPDHVAYLVPGSILCFVAFLLVEQRVQEPIVPLDLFSSPVISNASLVSIMLGGAMLSFVTFLPLYVEGVRRLGVFYAGLSIIPMGIGWPVASGISARLLPRVGFRVLLRTGLLLVFVGSLSVALSAYWSLPFGALMAGMGVLGLGMGFSNIPLLFSVQTSVQWNRRGTATASTLFFRTIGGTITVGVMGAILAKALSRDPSLPLGLANDLIGPAHGAGVLPEMLDRLAAVMDWGLFRIFFGSSAVALCALIFGLFFPDIGKEAKLNEEIEGL